MTALQFAALCLPGIGVGLLAWGAGRHDVLLRLRRWRTWRARVQAARRQGHSATDSSLRTLRAAVPRRTSTNGDGAQTHAASDAAPRFLFLGDASAALPALLSAVEPAGPLPIDRPLDEEPFWRWWKLPRLIAIELCPPPLPPEMPMDMLWLQALHALARTQPHRPLGGIVLCVSPALLRSDPDVAQPLIRLLARRIHETAAALHQRLPVHLVLTGLQDLPGHAAVHAALPGHVTAQTLGWRPPPDGEASTWEDAASTLQAALDGLRLALLVQERSARERHNIHRFVEATLALLPGLQRVHEILDLGADPALLWQGLHLCAAAPRPAFVHDLFDHFLPASAALARDGP